MAPSLAWETWDYEEHLEQIDYLPQEQCNFLDVWVYGKKGMCGDLEEFREKECIVKEGNLSTNALDEYLNTASPWEPAPHSKDFVGGYRILYTYADNDIQLSSDSTVLWSREEFERIISAFSLPKRLSQMIAREHAMFAAFKGSVPNRFGYIFSTMFRHGPYWRVAASYDYNTNVTYALLNCKAAVDEECITRFVSFLKNICTDECHPLLLPVIIIDLETNLTFRDDQGYTDVVDDIEQETHQCASYDDNDLPEESTLDLPSIIHRANKILQFLSLIDRETHVTLRQLKVIQREVKDGRDQLMKEKLSTSGLLDHVQFLIDSREAVSFRLENVQRRAKIQLEWAYRTLERRGHPLPQPASQGRGEPASLPSVMSQDSAL